MSEQAASPDAKPKVKRGWKYWLKLVVFGLLILYPVNMILGYFITSYQWARPTRAAVCCNTPADADIEYEEVSFKNADGQTLRGWFMPGDNGATVILVHGAGGMRVAVIRHTLMLAGGDFSILSFDLRAHGESDGDTVRYDGDDVQAAYDYLLTRPDVDPDRIGVYGFSLGGMMAIQAASKEQGIKAVAVDEPGPLAFKDVPLPTTAGGWLYVPLDLVFFDLLPLWTGYPNGPAMIDAVSQISPRPLLIITQEDETYGAGISHHIAKFAKEPVTLHNFPPVGHGVAVITQADEYAKLLNDFFGETLMK